MNYQVRKIHGNDWQACHDIQHSGGHPHEGSLWSEDTWKFIAANLQDTFVVLEEKSLRVVGYWLGIIQVNTVEYDEKCGQLGCVALDACVHKDVRHTGVMDQIMQVACDYHEYIYGWTHAENHAALAIQKKWGFKKGDFIENRYGPGQHGFFVHYDRDSFTQFKRNIFP